MSQFLNSLNDKLTAVEQEMQNLPGELDSIVTRLDRGKLRNLFAALNRDFNEAFDKHLGNLFAAQGGWTFGAPSIVELTPPHIRSVTDEDIQKWRQAYKSDIRVVLDKRGVRVIAPSELAKKYQTTVAQVVLNAQRQSYAVLGWDDYQNLLDEIGSLIGGNEEQGGITRSSSAIGIPLPIHSTQQVKILPKSHSS